MKTLAGVALAPVCVVAVAGCSATSGSTADAPGAGGTAAPASSDDSQAAGRASVYGPIQDILQAGTDWETAETATDECTSKARKSVLPTKVLNQFNQARTEIGRRLAADPRVPAARAAWSAYMKRAGFNYDTPDQPPSDLDNRARPLFDTVGSGAPTEGAKALHAVELKTAAADWKCRSTTITPTLISVRNELESAFIEAHPDLVDKVRQEMSVVISGS